MKPRLSLRIGLALLAAGAIGTGLTAEEIKYAFWGNPDAIGVEKDIIDAYEAARSGARVTPIAVEYGTYHESLPADRQRRHPPLFLPK
jgi:multiple sugar transport system substrate-binding protein